MAAPPQPPQPPLLPRPLRRVVVFRALMLGDMLCATPALRALRAGLPEAHITWVGLPWAQALAERLTTVDEFIAFPGWPGLPESGPFDARRAEAFIESLRQESFDLALQLHGSGGIVNPLVASFGARCTAGLANESGWRPAEDIARYAQWREQGSEVERLLALTDHLGFARQGLQLDFPLRPADRQQARELLAAVRDRRSPPSAARAGASTGDAGSMAYAVVHAGSQLPSRRWPPERFAAVADGLAAQGLQVLLTGSSGEAGLTAAVAQAMQHPCHDLAGRTDLWTLGALIEGAAVLVCNDTGVSHIAASTGTRSVVVASGSDVARWAPADAQRHRVFWHDMPCRPCAEAVCPHGQACALAVDSGPVRQEALRAVASGRVHAG